jgi:hypothetical protein
VCDFASLHLGKYCTFVLLRLYGYQPIFKKPKTDPAAGIAIRALAVLPSNKCGAHQNQYNLYKHCFLRPNTYFSEIVLCKNPFSSGGKIQQAMLSLSLLAAG